MAYTAKYTEKIDAMVTPDMAEYIDDEAVREGVSKSAVVRDLLDAGRSWVENARLLGESSE